MNGEFLGGRTYMLIMAAPAVISSPEAMNHCGINLVGSTNSPPSLATHTSAIGSIPISDREGCALRIELYSCGRPVYGSVDLSNDFPVSREILQRDDAASLY